METALVLVPLGALAQRSRLDILNLLVSAGDDGLPVGRIGQCLGLRSANLSRHLHRLRRAGLIRQRRDGRRFIYSIEPDAIRAVFSAVSRVFDETGAGAPRPPFDQ
jgi:DNA-binding transcriptional ArsR family regulator